MKAQIETSEEHVSHSLSGTNKILRVTKTGWIVSASLLIVFNVFILFVVMPNASSRVRGLYNQNTYADGYDQLATTLAAGKGYRFYPDTAQTLLREPGYPLLLAGMHKLFGSSFMVVKMFNMVLAFLAAYLMAIIARRVSADSLLIFGAPLLFLFHPETLISESRGGIEVLFTFMLALYILTVYRADESQRWQDYAMSGAVLGAAALVRSTAILFPVILFLYLALSERRGRDLRLIMRNFVVTILAMFLVISPWVVRNYLLTKKFVPTASVLGVAAQTGLYFATHPQIPNVEADWDASQERNRLAQELGYPFRIGYYQYFYSPVDELAFSRYLFQRVLGEYKAHPLLFAKTVGFNLIRFWCGGKTGRSFILNAFAQFPLVALAITGIVLCIKAGRWKIIAPMVLLSVYLVGISLPILAQARYSGPLIPFMAILAGIPLVLLKQKLDKRDYVLSQPTR